MPHPARQVYRRLFRKLGPQHWWPGDSPLEVVLGAILTQNTAWTNVELALARLRKRRLFHVGRLSALNEAHLARLIRPAGTYRVKARRLRNFFAFLHERYGGSLRRMLAAPQETLRRELLAVNGIGPETADSILLYAAHRPVMVVDAYTIRIFARHGWVRSDIDYSSMQKYFTTALPRADAALWNEYHALLVHVGKHYCRRKPDCEHCPLRSLLGDRGPIL